MVCIAAFIILGIIVLTLPIIRLFSKKTADNIWNLFKKATHCFTRRVTLRTCDTSFTEDIKNSILRKVVLKHPKWVKPISATIEVGSLLIIILTVWSLLVGVKSLVSLYVYGTCNTNNPSACSLDSTEACSIDEVAPKFTEHPIQWTGDWFSDYGEAIAAIPTRMKHWDAKEYLPDNAVFYNKEDKSKPYAVDIFDPGCVVCKRSFAVQKNKGFFGRYNVALMPYPIKGENGYKFANSDVVARYMMGTIKYPLKNSKHPAAWLIADRMYTGKDKDGIDNQTAFNVGYSHDKAKGALKSWLKDFGYSDDEVKKISEYAESNAAQKELDKIADVVKNDIKTKKIPTTIFDGKRHDGELKETDIK